MATASPITPRRPQSPPPLLPERPSRRRAPRRAPTFFFWTVFLLFIAAIGYLGLLAFSANTERVVSAVVDSYRVEKFLLALAVVIAVAGGIATRHHMH
jgi:hypothetical protein